MVVIGISWWKALLPWLTTPTTAVAAFFGYLYLKWRTSPLRRVPGPKRSFWLGSFLEIQREPFLAPHKVWCRTLGFHHPFLVYHYVMGGDTLLVLDKTLIRLILSHQIRCDGKQSTPRFHKGPLGFLQSRLGKDGLLTLEGEDWKRHRRILTPSFQTNFLKERLNQEVPPLAHQLIKCWTRAGSDREIDAGSHLSALTVDVVGKVLFSHEFEGLQAIATWATKEKNDELDALDDHFLTALGKAIRPSTLSLLLVALNLQWLDFYLNPNAKSTARDLDQAADRILEHAMETNTRHAKSLLHLLLEAEDEDSTIAPGRLTLLRGELRDEIKTFLMAGHETTSTWLYWCLFVLAKNPLVQSRLFKDIVGHVGEGDITQEETAKMEYFQGFLQEVLRLYPPAGIAFRFSSYPEEMAGYNLPAGTRFAIPIHLLHRHPHYWDNPEEFQPERWINVSKTEEERRRFAFLPFSAGARNCIGQRFATLEVQLVLAPIVRTLEVSIAPSQKDTNHTFTAFGTMKARPGLRIAVRPRASAER